MKLKEQYLIKGKIKVLTGLCISGEKETFRIGGLDNSVIKLKNGEPYIPGSSLKGKIRCLLERKEDLKEPCSCGECNICILFGSSKTETTKRPNVLIFRDAFLEKKDREKEEIEKLFEIKTENVINRITGKSMNLRIIERVVPGTEFEVEIVFNEYEGDNHIGLLEKLKEGFELLSNDYLGSSGTRGYGKVDVTEVIRSIEGVIELFKKQEVG
ncbi:MAG: type III-A CRISPR-associated RAMP protein Csm3 [Candidatus Pacearchaeota archaeon]